MRKSSSETGAPKTRPNRAVKEPYRHAIELAPRRWRRQIDGVEVMMEPWRRRTQPRPLYDVHVITRLTCNSAHLQPNPLATVHWYREYIRGAVRKEQ